MMYKTIFSILIILSTITYATNVNANFRSTVGEPYHFNTDMQFTTDFTLSVTSGDVASGDPDDIRSGDVVCSGATIEVNPTVDAKWAVSSIDIDSLYPDCPGFGYCPEMISYSAFNDDINIGWISNSKFNDHDDFGDSNPFSTSTSRYDDLGTFHYQRATYYNISGTFNNKRIQANVFCKGDFEVRDGGSTVSGGSSAMPSIPSPSFTVTSTGTHQISTRLSDVECIAVAAKNPLDYESHTEYFYLYYFTSNQPSIASSIATETISITVEESGGSCNIFETSVDASSSLTDEDLIMIVVTMENDGDPVEIMNVSSSNSGFVVDPFPVSICDPLGFPPSVCPSSNGFEESLGSGETTNLYVLVERTTMATGGTILTFGAQTEGSTCGGSSTCTEAVNLGDDLAIACEIEPPSLEYGTLEVAEFLVTCENLAGESIPCVGDDWYWESISGDFIERDNEHALAYPTSSPGSEGTLNYESGIAHCLSDINVVEPYYECEFIPSSAELNVSESQYFELNCFEEDEPSTPDDADYDTTDGLDGTITDSSTDGTTFTGDSPSSGDLRGFGQWDNPADDPVLGAVALAPITVGTGNDTNLTDPVSCEIEPTSLTYGTEEIAEFLVTCENFLGDEIPCIGSNWYWEGIVGGFVIRTNEYTHAYPTSPPGSSGTLNYQSGLAHCTSDIDVVEPYYECDFDPSSAEMDTGDIQYFELICTEGGSPSTPDDTTYDTIGGLDGTITGSSNDGTSFIAGTNSTGDLRGSGYWNNPIDDPILGAVAIADITIGDGGDTPEECDVPDPPEYCNDDPDDPDDGSSEWCTIGDGPLNVYPDYFGWVPIACGPDADQPCYNVTWIEQGAVDLSDGTDSGTNFHVTGDPGETGRIIAYVNNTPDFSCYRGFTIQEPDCWEYS
jgi:hypothetical protein